MQQPRAEVETKRALSAGGRLCVHSAMSDARDKKTRKTFQHPLLVEPSAWAPLYGAWQEQAKSTRELADLAKDGLAKSLLTQIAETYERLARPQ
jgi:hypothetical protein